MTHQKISPLQKIMISLFLLFSLTVTGKTYAKQVAPIQVDSIVAPSGEKVSGFIEVPALSDKASRIPITIINGAKKGPTLTLIGGTHGYEYAPIIALQHLAKTIDANELSGAIIIVHIANMPAFLGRNIYYSPVDHKNLNRVYPGNAEGSLSERIADAITKNVINQSNYLIDMHSGDGNEELRPYIYMPHTGNVALDGTIKAMALSFGIDHIIIDRAPISAPDKSVFTDMTALSRGIPAITTEVGRVGSTDAKWVNKNITGVMSLLRHLNMLSGDPLSSQSIVWLENYQVVESPQTGVFIPSVSAGYMVAKDGLLGELVDFFGNHITQIKAPFSGVVNYVIVTPPVSKGEPLVMLSHIRKEPQ
jgi:predicted deacylase